MALVLFDLDNTLLTGDSEEAWTRYLKEQGLVGQEFFKKKSNLILIIDRAGSTPWHTQYSLWNP